MRNPQLRVITVEKEKIHFRGLTEAIGWLKEESMQLAA
jgi:hypothetical protein